MWDSTQIIVLQSEKKLQGESTVAVRTQTKKL